MSDRLLDLYLRYRVALPLASFLIYLNTTQIVLGRIGFKSLYCGLSFVALMEIMYAYDARFRNKEDVINLPEGRAVSHGVRSLLLAAALPVALLLSAGFWPLLLYATLAIAVYSDPHILPRQFKSIPGLKMLVNMLNFWTVGILAPMLFIHELSFGLVGSALRVSVPFLVLLFSLNVLIDIRDAVGDRAAGVWTFPAAIGVPASAGLIVLLFLGCGTVAVVRGDVGGAGFAFGLAALSSAAVKPRSRLYYEWVLAFTNVYLAGLLVFRFR
jgi:hypothetical protein